MCELFGVSADRKIRINDHLRAFFAGSAEHRHGWGIALLDGTEAEIIKEPVKALDSLRIKTALENDIYSSCLMAHIRQATIGDVSTENTHPFVRSDRYGREWVLVHNGTIFDSPYLNGYRYTQEGSTDSERILLHIAERMEEGDNFEVIESIVRNITPGNKVNLLLYGGGSLYVHKNEPGTLFRKIGEGQVLFATRPLSPSGWEEIPQNTLLEYRDGKLVREGIRHGNTYIHDEEKMRLIYVDHSML